MRTIGLTCCWEMESVWKRQSLEPYSSSPISSRLCLLPDCLDTSSFPLPCVSACETWTETSKLNAKINLSSFTLQMLSILSQWQESYEDNDQVQSFFIKAVVYPCLKLGWFKSRMRWESLCKHCIEGVLRINMNMHKEKRIGQETSYIKVWIPLQSHLIWSHRVSGVTIKSQRQAQLFTFFC